MSGVETRPVTLLSAREAEAELAERLAHHLVPVAASPRSVGHGTIFLHVLILADLTPDVDNVRAGRNVPESQPGLTLTRL